MELSFAFESLDNFIVIEKLPRHGGGVLLLKFL